MVGSGNWKRTAGRRRTRQMATFCVAGKYVEYRVAGEEPRVHTRMMNVVKHDGAENPERFGQ